MISIDLDAALAAGVTVVTPNRRLARELVSRYDAAAARSGARTWTAVRALPWDAWLQTLWHDALAAHALPEPRPLLGAPASAFMWDRIVADGSNLLDPHGAAERAAGAWKAFHAWREPGETPDPWARAGIDDDAAAFATWARRFADERDALGRRIDDASLADHLAAAAPRIASLRGRALVFAGFLEFTPQQRRLLTALETAGAAPTTVALPRPRRSRCLRVTAHSPRDELVAALSFARARALAQPEADIAIVVADLEERREDAVAIAEDLLCPALLELCDADAPRPYSVSLATPLAQWPLAASALALIEWAARPLPLASAAALLRSPYLPGAVDVWWRRAGCERLWRELGLRDVTFQAAALALSRRNDDALAARWRAAAAPTTTRRSPSAWADTWRAWLAAVGWPGERTLDSGEWQTRDAFLRLLGEFAALSPVAPTMNRDEALSALRAAGGRKLFQPESAPAHVRILGMLEASGLEFDALWLAGLGAPQWPPPMAPTPLLPLAWQRARGLPRADAARSLDYARTLTAAFAHAAGEVVASHAREVDGQERAASTLFVHWPEAAPSDVPRHLGRAEQIAADRPALQKLTDALAPALPEASAVRGGVDVIESQSSCPFQAFARHRLRARPAADARGGLSPQERGILLHRLLAEFWTDVGDHATLMALDDAALRARISAAVKKARTALDAQRWRTLPLAVAAAEAERLAVTLHAWLTAVERERTPFTVSAIEAKARLAIGGIELDFRVDRVDTLAAGGLAVIDYKSGRAPGPGRWFAQRPAGTQIGLYALAQRVRTPAQPVVAAAYAQLKAGDVAVRGLAADDVCWPGLPSVQRARGVALADWREVEAAWARSYAALAGEFRTGRAAVTPRDPTVCRVCGLQPLCRIQRLDDVDAGIEDAAADD
ncbi:MAG: PD-(D/E)XK nuclease family protein [Burkholderiales bacterium]|nr:PD-(D/E)XK nuclease family protein [Burkholderiales bacterium]